METTVLQRPKGALMNLARPGSQHGPCQTDCPHPRCRRSRQTATLICPLCRKEIGYGNEYVKEEKRNGRLVHAACAETAERFAAAQQERIGDQAAVAVCCSCGQEACICEM